MTGMSSGVHHPMATEGNAPNRDFLTKIGYQFEEQIDILPKIQDYNAVTVHENPSRIGGK